MQQLNFDHTLALILAKDSRYHAEAYHFVKDSLEHTQKLMARKKRMQARHVSGVELLEGIRDYALTQYGPMTQMVLSEWGITRCEDFGEIVFNLVDIGLLGKTEQDSREDFKNGYDFDDAFRKPFLPLARQQPKRASTPKSAEA